MRREEEESATIDEKSEKQRTHHRKTGETVGVGELTLEAERLGVVVGDDDRAGGVVEEGLRSRRRVSIGKEGKEEGDEQ